MLWGQKLFGTDTDLIHFFGRSSGSNDVSRQVPHRLIVSASYMTLTPAIRNIPAIMICCTTQQMPSISSWVGPNADKLLFDLRQYKNLPGLVPCSQG